MNVEVTSASKKEQKLSQIPAAVLVITQEDIRRSGATNIPDVLRMVPGLDVAQVNGSTWAIGSRGFNQQFSNKLLVMIDGRIVYTPNFAGVYWDTLDLPLEDIERIEVIRGPGGSIWGANAVNGVIGIFTKSAKDTQGGLTDAVGGSNVQGSGTVQYGGDLAHGTKYRAYAKYFNLYHQRDFAGEANGADGWHMLRGGFRTDSTLTPKDSLTLEGDLYAGREGELGLFLPSITSPSLVPLAEEINLSGGFIQGTWQHQYSGKSESTLQASLTRYTRRDPLEPETRDTIDLDYHQHFAWKKRHDLVWGLGYHETSDEIGGSLTVSFNPPSRSLQVFNAFIEDEIALVPDRVYFTIGTKLEHNDYTGFEVMPTARVTWTPSTRHTLWAAVSKALRAPSRNDTNLVVNLGSTTDSGGNLVLTRFSGNPNSQDERLIAYEAGYRTEVTKQLSLDIAAYFNDYDDLQTTEPGTPFFEPLPAPAHQVQPFTFKNLAYGESHGFEIAASWQVAKRWQIKPGFAFANEHVHLERQSLDTTTVNFVEGSAPDHMLQLRSHLELPRRVSWDLSAYYQDALTNQGIPGNIRVPSQMRLDTGATWIAGEHFSVSLVGQNLLMDHRLEFADVFGSMQSGQLRRSAYVKLTWKF